ncbi:recombination-associated protein RdgC [Pseudoalteromonas umbrosa]|uniref:recombination-associated protein RdgC n=1 Tax=Pseudoalteromonas umbrosa TaxID=3048489 RepID=UPI0024C32D2D|nr:recombination-associated protein RdgC [Pseudoalteromonas sp. B95]MDK1289817.1 recombination-associated protein RdgC [Pseudoalteromonas sp. B95]
MRFTNLIAYKYKTPIAYTQEQLEQSLQQDAFRKCGAQEYSTFGWTKALGKHGATLSHFSKEFILLCAKVEEKILPATVVNEKLAEKVQQIELDENRTVKKKEKDELKDSVYNTLLAQAFTKSSLHFAFIDMKRGLFVVNSSSFNKAEQLAALFRKSVGTLPIIPAFCDFDLDVHLTDWLTKTQAPENFSLGYDTKLEDPTGEGDEVALKRHALGSDETRLHLDSGKRVTELALKWGENIEFTLKNDGSLKRLSYSDTIKESNADIPKEDIPAKLDADFLLCAGEISELLDRLFSAMGVSDNQEQAA